MIKSISIENFKGIGDEVTIDLKPITLLFGANSAGKSTIVHALHYAREILERGNLDPDKTIGGGPHVDLGGFLGLVHGKTEGKHRTVKLRIEFDADETSLPSSGVDYSPFEPIIGFEIESLVDRFGSIEIEMTVFFNPWEDAPVLSEASVILDGKLFCKMQSDSGGNGAAITKLETDHSSLLQSRQDITTDIVPTCLGDLLESCGSFLDGSIMLSGDMDDVVRGKDIQAELYSFEVAEEEARQISLSRKVMAAISEIVSGAFTLAKKELSEFRYLGPLRDTPSRNFEPPKTEMPSRWASGLAAWDALKLQSDEFVIDVSSWLGDPERLDSGCQLDRRSYYVVDKTSEIAQKVQRSTFADDAEPIQSHEIAEIETLTRLKLVSTGSDNVEFDPQDVGTGISQVIPVIVASLLDNEQLVAIEQPELHVHPRIQAELGDLFIDAWQRKQNQFILETHSEHLILRLQRRVREHRISQDDVGVYYVSQGEDGQTRVNQLRLDDEGDFIDNWPGGFFPERLKEI